VLSAESYLATYTLARFQLSQGFFGPTEIRILLAAGSFAALRSPYSTVLGHRMLLFDLGGIIAAVLMSAMALIVTARHTAELYRQEPLKQESLKLEPLKAEPLP
jgi:archaetidylinositol phosphate synthase